jgi:CRISPR/Cas system-associated endonuclease/helicase Cas3
MTFRHLGKPGQLVKLTAEAALPKVLIEEAVRLRQEGADVVAVVCNLVARARATFERLQAHGETMLLTGRIRPYDKEKLTEGYLAEKESDTISAW